MQATFDFADQVVMVTGGSGNLGGAVARAFYAAGARLVVPDRSADRLPAMFPELADAGRHYLVGSTDLSQPEDVARLVEATLERFGQIDVLVNTVGGYRAGAPPHETSLETWDFMLNLNARTAFLTGRAVIPAMLERGRGKIINTAARSALAGGANEVAYSASKSMVARITESFAAAYKAKGINVNAIVPGTIDTPQNREAMPKADFGRWVQPESIAQVVLFLASDAASIINGALIPVYGLT
jgi:NAD(P)-dependent dehydrogenase (short-subunit alcohol dehydrogenase family)